MSDMIERDEVFAIIADLKKEYPTHSVPDAEAKVALRKVADKVKNLPTIEPKRGEWILCSERLPEEREWIGTKKFGTTISDEVLVTFESRGERFVRPMHFQNGELGGMDKHMMDAIHGEWKAVAWMPLPKPWKGADDE